MPFTLYYQASWSLIQQVLYLTLNSLGRKTEKKKKKTKLLSFFLFFLNTVTTFQLCRVSHGARCWKFQSGFKEWMWIMNLYVTMNDHQVQPDRRHSSLWCLRKDLKSICRAGRGTEREGMGKKKNTHFCPVFFFLRRTFKEPCDLHILSL